MTPNRPAQQILAALALLAALAGSASAQGAWDARESNVVVPQMHSVLLDQGSRRLTLTKLETEVSIVGQVATTTLDIHLANGGARVEEATLLVPVFDGAVVRGFDFEGAASEPTARVLPADEARRDYEAIVSRSRDPALLEFAAYNSVRTSVFPVPAGGAQRVRLVYEHLLPAYGDRVDYVLPRSESLVSAWIPWTLDVHVRASGPISTVYSPSHEVRTQRISDRELSISMDEKAAREPGSFHLSYLLQGAGVSASIFAYPDARVGGGYFLLLAGPPVSLPEGEERQEREVILVLDRSGSMNGEKFEQARDAALQVLQGLEEGETFNLIVYSDQITMFANRPVARSAASLADARSFLKSLRAGGGTNLEGALRESLRQEHDPRRLPIVLFLTDGLPTVGVKSESTIRRNAVDYNEHDRRIFTFGVGYDVNVPLLDHLASVSRASSEYVQPSEDVEAKVSRVFERLHGPVLARPRLTIAGPGGAESAGLVNDVLPSDLPDLYEGDQLVLLGAYTREEPVTFRLEGDWFGKEERFEFDFDLARSSVSNSFVPRLWASRRIGVLVDEIRQGGADVPSGGQPLMADAHTKELLAEIVSLSTEFGILTEYTSFLALEGTDLAAQDTVLVQLDENLRSRARTVRTGRAALNQSSNITAQRVQKRLNRTNSFLDADMRRVRNTRIAQVGSRTFFRRDGHWVDARLVRMAPDVGVTSVVTIGSNTHRDLVERLAERNDLGIFSLRGSVLFELDGEAVMLAPPPPKKDGKNG